MVKRIELNSQDDWTTIKSMISDFASFRPTVVFRDQSHGKLFWRTCRIVSAVSSFKQTIWGPHLRKEYNQYSLFLGRLTKCALILSGIMNTIITWSSQQELAWVQVRKPKRAIVRMMKSSNNGKGATSRLIIRKTVVMENLGSSAARAG